MELEEAIEILKEFKKTGYHTLMAKYNTWDRIKANTMIEIAIETVLNYLTKQEKMIQNLKKTMENDGLSYIETQFVLDLMEESE